MMSRNQTCFEVTVTPPYKKKPILEPSPILILEKFKGSPSLLFKDVKVGSSASKGFWIQNPNDCTITVILAKLPPAERGLSFSDLEFVLEAGGSLRVEVTWCPTCEGSWRDVVQVQVWGLPPPHLCFRLILHLTSVLPKIKRKCCQMAPLRSRNVSSSKSLKVNIRSGCCHSHPALNGKGKENISKKEPILAIEKRTPKRSSAMDRDSLENSPPGQKNIDFVSVDDGFLPPCNVPSTPIRRSTYSITNDQAEVSCNPIHTATFTVEEKTEELKSGQRFLKALEEPWSPINFNKNVYKENTPTRSIPVMNIHGPEQCSTKIKTKNFASPSEATSAKHLFANEDMRVESRPIESSPLQNPAAKCLLTPPCSPIHSASPGCRAEVSITAGYREQRQFAAMTAYVNINHTFIKDSRSEFEMEEVIQKACSIIQRNWRRVKEEKKRQMEEAERFEVLEKACSVIQRNWRYYLARRQGKRDRAEIWLRMHYACCIIQRSWKSYLLRKRVAIERAAMLQKMTKSASIIQKNWRLYLARRQAKKDRREIWILMHNSCCIIQRNWHFYLARKQARENRAKIFQEMNQASSVIQRSWRFYLARKQARKDRFKVLQEMNQASFVIQRSWRFYLSRMQARENRVKIFQEMNQASSVIQRSWRFYLARKQARKDRFKVLQEMNQASFVIQRSWRFYLSRMQARENRAKIFQEMNQASSVIQRSWRFYLSRMQARKDRFKVLQEMNQASFVIQRSWRFYLSRMQARENRAKIFQEMNQASSVIQRSWRFYLSRMQARKDRFKVLQEMNQASFVIQRSWRFYLSRMQARENRAKIFQEMNQASSVIQRSWRFYLSRMQARKDRFKVLQEMNQASFVIQRSWRFYLSRMQARENRAKIFQEMNQASSVIQRSWRFYLARKQARKDRAVVAQHMNEACSVIQRSWRVYFARKMAARGRAEMFNACCVIQRSWRNYVARKRDATLASIKRNYDCSDVRNATEDTFKPDKCLFEMLEKFHLKPRAYELLFELADLHPLENLQPVFLFIQNSIRNGEWKSKKSIAQCDMATQTDSHLRDGEFARPVTRSLTKASHTKVSSSRISARRSLLGRTSIGYLSPIRVKSKQREVPEKERWSCVAEAVGRQNFTPQK